MATQTTKTTTQKPQSQKPTRVDRALAILARKGTAGASLDDLSKEFKQPPQKVRSVIGAIRAAGGKVDALGGGVFVLRKKPS